MTLSSFVNLIRPKHVFFFSIVLVTANLLVNVFSTASKSLDLFNAAFGLAASFIVTVFTFVIFYVARKNKYTFARPLLWLGFSTLLWLTGDIVFYFLRSAEKPTFVSYADLFYILATLMQMIGMLTIPGSLPASRRRNMVFVEISILILSAAVIFSILLLIPGNPYLNYDPFSLLMVFIYPVLDILLIWIITILFFTYPSKPVQKVLGLFFIGALFLFISDLLYLIYSLYEPVLNDYYVDMGYYFYYSSLVFGSLIGFIQIREKGNEQTKKVKAFNAGNWIIFLPGVFLSIVIGLLLVFVMNYSREMMNSIVVLIILIVVLFIIHQYLVIADNIKLTREMKHTNARLEGKVHQRTAELSNSNHILQNEMRERQNAEMHLARSNNDLALLNKDKDKLFSTLAHDLRSPLGSMMKLSELLVENIKEFDETELFEIINTINKSATQTFQLLNDLLAWSAVQMGRGLQGKELFSVSEIVTEISDSQTDEALKKQIEIVSEINPELKAYADKFAIQTILRNLLNNAVKFTQHEGRIKLNAQSINNQIRISITDNGVGISKEKQKMIFRVDGVNSTAGTDGEKGTGFGLLLCKDLVERNGGEIWLESEKDKGTTIYFTLPGTDSAAPDVSIAHIAAAGRLDMTYDHTKKLGFIVFAGEFTAEILISDLQLLWASSDYKAEYSVLVDLRQATFRFENINLQIFADVFTLMPGKRLNRKFAFLTTTPQQVAYSTMFGQHIKSKYPFSIEIFSTYEACLSWLGG